MKIKFIPAILLLIYLHGCGDYSEELSGRYVYISEGENYNIIIKGEKLIPCDVVSYDWDDSYIIAAQVMQRDKCIEQDNTPLNLIGTLNFWIINIRKDTIYGPLSFKEFNKIKKELKVSKSLSLNVKI